MKRFFLFFGLLILAMIGLFLVIGATMPKDFRVERSIEIDATTAAVHAYVGDLGKWDAWTPWKEVDPELVVTLGEETTGVGASQEWVDVSGGGRLEFVSSDENAGIAYDLYFADFPKVDAEMSYEKLGAGKTKVVWVMSGTIPIPIIGGFFASAMDMQAGPMFELGLEKLKAVVE